RPWAPAPEPRAAAAPPRRACRRAPAHARPRARAARGWADAGPRRVGGRPPHPFPLPPAGGEGEERYGREALVRPLLARHSRESGNPVIQRPSLALDPRFRGDDDQA